MKIIKILELFDKPIIMDADAISIFEDKKKEFINFVKKKKYFINSTPWRIQENF